jgi:hypothetical protein
MSASFKTTRFIRFLRQMKILILKILNVCLRFSQSPMHTILAHLFAKNRSTQVEHFENGS